MNIQPALRCALCAALLSPGAFAARAQDAADRVPSLIVRALSPTGEPVVDARVEARIRPRPPRESWGRFVDELALVGEAVTDPSGVARLFSAASATWRVEVHAEGRASAFRVVEVDAGRSRSLTVRLAAGHVLQGTVTQEDDAPVQGATVIAGPVGFEADHARVLARATSDEQGRYRLAGLPKGGIDVWANRPGSGMRWFGRIAVPNFTRHDLSFPRGGRLIGVVSDSVTGDPVSGVRIRVKPFGGGWAAEAVSDEQGRYELYAFSPRLEVHGLDATSPGRRLLPADDLPPKQLFDLAAGETIERDLLLAPAPRVVGTVAADGRAVGGARVTLHSRGREMGGDWSSRTAVTDGDGEFVFEGAQPGAVVIQVAAAGYEQADFPEDWRPFFPEATDVPDAALTGVGAN